MGNWIAMIGSSVIGALVLLALLRFNADATRDSYVTTMEYMTYENLNSVVEILQCDFSRMGNGVTDFNAEVIESADSSDITFRLASDCDDNPMNTLRYHLGDTSTASMTTNPNDRMLRRSVDGGTAENVLPVIQFQLTYLDTSGNELSPPLSESQRRDVRTIVIDLTLESAENYDGTYPRITWQGRVMPPKLARR